MRRLQLTQLEMLKVVDGFCKKYGIHYSLYAGTLLGAVRHKGFIPWDDDLDICMPRKEYDRFLVLWQQNPVEGYILQNKDISPAYMNSFSKIRKDHTTFLEHEEDIGQFHTGIFIDIFPLDRIPSAWLPKRLFYLRCMLYQLMMREYAPKEGNPAVRLGSRLLLKLIPTGKRAGMAKNLLKKLKAYQYDSAMNIVGIETMRSVKIEYPSTMFDVYSDLPFETNNFPVFSQWDMNLRSKFGEYMQLPPEEQRIWTHHPICIDFEKNIEEILTAQHDKTNTYSLPGL